MGFLCPEPCVCRGGAQQTGDDAVWWRAIPWCKGLLWQCPVSCPQSSTDAMLCVQRCDPAQQTHPDGEWPFKIEEFHNLLSWLCASTVRHGAASTSGGSLLKRGHSYPEHFCSHAPEWRTCRNSCNKIPWCIGSCLVLTEYYMPNVLWCTKNLGG